MNFLKTLPPISCMSLYRFKCDVKGIMMSYLQESGQITCFIATIDEYSNSGRILCFFQEKVTKEQIF